MNHCFMSTRRSLLGISIVLFAHSAAALTELPQEEVEFGKSFDTSSPRSQKMVTILCFGRDKSFCAGEKQPSRYYGMGFRCEWPALFADNMTPDALPPHMQVKELFTMPASALLVGAPSLGQRCSFRVEADMPQFFNGTKDGEDLMAYVEWEFEKEPIPQLNGKIEGNKVILPYFLKPKRDGAHFKSPWDKRTPKNYQSDIYALPSRAKAVAQRSWMTLIINGQVIDKIEIPLYDQALQWRVYDWRKKEGSFFERKHGSY